MINTLKIQVQVLTDPWSETSSIYTLNTHTLEYTKDRDFPNYLDQLYTDNVIW